MRLNRTTLTLTLLTLTVFALALTSPATAAGRECKPVYATLDTMKVEPAVEIGGVEGTINGAAYLRFDEAEPPIDPQLARANFVITSKLGAIKLWVYSENVPDGETWWRDFEILRAEGTGIYAKQRIILEIYGKCSLKAGQYEIEGMICPPFAKPPRK